MFVCLFLFCVCLFVCLFVSNAQGTRGLGISSRKSTRSAFASGRMEVPPTTRRATQHHQRRAHRRPCTTRTRSTKQRRLSSFSEQQLAVVYGRLPDVMLQLRSSYILAVMPILPCCAGQLSPNTPHQCHFTISYSQVRLAPRCMMCHCTKLVRLADVIKVGHDQVFASFCNI
jgi:hypothetical protein